jgi:hypothetical protein
MSDMTETLPPPNVDDEDIIDISDPTRPKVGKFKLNGKVYLFAPAVPLVNFAKLADLQRKVGDEFRDLDALWELWGLVMPPESVAQLKAAAADMFNPVDHRDMIRIQRHMVETWGKDQTGPSTPSSTGSDGEPSGSTSTDGAQPEASTPLTSPPTGS